MGGYSTGAGSLRHSRVLYIYCAARCLPVAMVSLVCRDAFFLSSYFRPQLCSPRLPLFAPTCDEKSFNIIGKQEI